MTETHPKGSKLDAGKKLPLKNNAIRIVSFAYLFFLIIIHKGIAGFILMMYFLCIIY